MRKQILLYSAIYAYTAASFIKDLADNKNSNIEIRVNTPGGSVLDGYGMIAQISEHEKDIFLKVDGQAASMGAILCLFVPTQNIEALDVSTFLFHRAAYGWWIEDDKKAFTPELQASLKKVNDHLRAAMEGKFTADQWFKETGVSLDDLFSIDSRIDVEISAEQAKRLGIIGSIKTITPEKRAEINSLSAKIAAIRLPETATATATTNSPAAVPTNNDSNKKTNKMTLPEFKAANPEGYEAILKEGAKEERDRVGSFLTFAHLDLKACIEGIESGEKITQKQMSEFTLKGIQSGHLSAITAENPQGVETPEAEKAKTATQEKVKDFQSAVFSDLGITRK